MGFPANELVRAMCISVPHRHAGNSAQPGKQSFKIRHGVISPGWKIPPHMFQLDLYHHLRSPITSTATKVSAAAAKQQQ
jgi:hypothetical protein